MPLLLTAWEMALRAQLREELKKLETKMKYALDTRDAVDKEIRKLGEAVEKGEEGPELNEKVKAAKELLKLLEKERDAMDDLIKRASTILDKLRSMTLLRRFSAFFGGFLIFIGSMAITSGAFMIFIGIMRPLVPPDIEEIMGIIAISLGVLLVLSGFIHQVP